MLQGTSSPNSSTGGGESEKVQKILVIGSGGAGKSTVAKSLGRLLKIEVIHLDALYWKPGWVEISPAEWNSILEELMKRDSWIMDGNYSNTLDRRLEACDTVVFLDIPRSICLWRVLKRWILYRGKKRPDMAEGCSERFSLEFLQWVWGYKNRSRPKVIKMLTQNAQNKNVIWLRSDTEVRAFLARAKQVLHSR